MPWKKTIRVSQQKTDTVNHLNRCPPKKPSVLVIRCDFSLESKEARQLPQEKKSLRLYSRNEIPEILRSVS